MNWKLSILAASALAVASLWSTGPATAAPQALALVATHGKVALNCDGHVCKAEFSTFCLQPDRMSPDIHIYTKSKQPWVLLPSDVPAVAEYYQASDYWPEASLERIRA